LLTNEEGNNDMSELQTVASKGDVSPGQCVAVDVGGQQVALFNVEGNYFAIGGTCTHRGGTLADGQVDSMTVTCPLHRAKFDIRTGTAIGPPASTGVPAYNVVVEDDDIKIEMP
jgi:3-phenylpropionate/trans-cinnamate dioxygenase ferredoxin subunit